MYKFGLDWLFRKTDVLFWPLLYKKTDVQFWPLLYKKQMYNFGPCFIKKLYICFFCYKARVKIS